MTRRGRGRSKGGKPVEQRGDTTSTPKRRISRVKVPKSRNLWERRNADGSHSFEITYTDPATGKQHWKTLDAKTRTDARAERDAFFAALGKGEAVSPNALTFEDVGREYLARLEAMVAAGEKAPRTLATYTHDLEAHVFPALGRIKVQKLTPDHLARFFAEKRAAGLADYTRAGFRSPISRILKMALRKRYISVSPLDALEDDELPRGKPQRQGRILNRDEIARLLANAVPGYFAILATFVFAGLRMQEALGLVWGDIDFDANVIRVRAQLSRATKTEPGRRVPLKAKGSKRDVRLLPELRKILLAHKTQAFERGLAGTDNFVFVTEKGKSVYHRNVATRGLDKAADRAGLNPPGLPRLVPHDLRKTFGSHLVKSGLDVVSVSRQIGHSRPSVTLDVYAQEFAEVGQADVVAAKLQAAFGGILD
jgi:integrase